MLYGTSIRIQWYLTIELQVHAGFQKQWNSVAEDVLDFLESEVSDNPGAF